MKTEISRKIPDNVLFPYGKGRIEESRGLKRWLLQWIPYYFYIAMSQELRLIRIRIKHRILGSSFKGRRNLLVNLGCGATGRSGWVNIDTAPGPNVNVVYDLRKQIPLPDRSAAGIFCEHFLEHLEYSEEIPFFVAECHRILRSGGVLRVIVPDAEAYMRAYCSGGWQELARIRPLLEGQKDYWYGNHFETRMELVNLVFRQGIEHKFAYDWETLENLFRKHGFSRVTRCIYGQGELAELCIDKGARVSESLYVEAVK